MSVAVDSQLRGPLLHVNDRRFELRVLSAERGDELRHTRMPAQLAEGLGCLDEGDSKPAKNHLAAVPLRNVVRRLANATVEELDRVRRRQSAREALGEIEAHHRERLVETLAERRGGGGMLAFQLASEPLEHALGARRVATLVRRRDRASRVAPHALREMVLDVALLVNLASLDERAHSELGADRLRERLTAVDDEEHRAIRADATRFEVGEQAATGGRVLRRAFVEAEGVLVTLLVNPERDQHEVLGDVDAVDHDGAKRDVAEVATHHLSELVPRRR